MAGKTAIISWRWKKHRRHDWRRQSETERQDRYCCHAVTVATGRDECVGRTVRARDCRRMSSSIGNFVRSTTEAGQGEVRVGTNGDPDPPGRPASNNLHAVRSDPTYGVPRGDSPSRP